MPRNLDRDDMFYVVASDTNNGKQFSYVVAVSEGENLAQILSNHPYVNSTAIYADRDEAHHVSEIHNATFRQNGTFGYQDPETSIWHIYDKDKKEMIHGDEALSNVIDNAVNAIHNPETINVAQLDVSDSNLVAKGYYGHNMSVAWSVTKDGTLYINGKHITNEGNIPPWSAYNIKKCVINADTIDSCAFQGSRLKADNIEVHAKIISAGAFSYNDNVKTLNVFADNIADSAFTGCNKLKNANIHCNEEMQPFALANNQALEFVNITGDIDTLQDGTFNGCANLKCVTVEGNTQLSNHAVPEGTKVMTGNNKQIGDDTRAIKTTNVRQRAGEHRDAIQKKNKNELVR